MIDIMFFLLVFFMLSTLYMSNIKTVPVNIPNVQNSDMTTPVNYLITLKKDGSIYLKDKIINEQSLLEHAEKEEKKNSRFAVIIRADRDINYGLLMSLMDKLRGVGITHLGLATDKK